MTIKATPVFQTIPSDITNVLEGFKVKEPVKKQIQKTLDFLADGIVAFLGEIGKNEIEIQVCLMHIQSISENLSLKKDDSLDKPFRYCQKTKSLKVNESLFKTNNYIVKLNLLIELGYAYECSTSIKDLSLNDLKDNLATYIEECISELESESFFKKEKINTDTPLKKTKKDQAFLNRFRTKMRDKLVRKMTRNHLIKTSHVTCSSSLKRLARQTIYQSVSQFEDLTTLEHNPSIRDFFMCTYLFQKEESAIESIEELFNSKDNPFWTTSLAQKFSLEGDSVIRKNEASKLSIATQIASVEGVYNLFSFGLLEDRDAFDLLLAFEKSKENTNLLFEYKPDQIGLYKVFGKPNTYLMVCGDKYQLTLNMTEAWWSVIL